jgi:hypothetical protein
MASMAKKAPPPKPGEKAAEASADKKGDKKDKKKKEESDEDVEADDKPEEENAAGVAEANQLKSEIEPMLKSGGGIKALTTAIDHKGQSVELLRMQAALACQSMEVIKSDEIAKFVDQATDEQLDVLMRVVYHGMSTGKNCPNLLIWHSKITDKGGIGAIMRAMCGKSLTKDG